jgi:hypothetical protein
MTFDEAKKKGVEQMVYEIHNALRYLLRQQECEYRRSMEWTGTYNDIGEIVDDIMAGKQ